MSRGNFFKMEIFFSKITFPRATRRASASDIYIDTVQTDIVSVLIWHEFTTSSCRVTRHKTEEDLNHNIIFGTTLDPRSFLAFDFTYRVIRNTTSYLHIFCKVRTFLFFWYLIREFIIQNMHAYFDVKFTSNWRFIFPRLVICVKYGSFIGILYQFDRLPVLCVKYDSFYSYINYLDFLFLIVIFHFSVSETLFDNRDNYFEISSVFVLTLVFINFKKSLRPIVLDNLFG